MCGSKYGLWEGRAFYCATPTVTLGLWFVWSSQIDGPVIPDRRTNGQTYRPDTHMIKGILSLIEKLPKLLKGDRYSTNKQEKNILKYSWSVHLSFIKPTFNSFPCQSHICRHLRRFLVILSLLSMFNVREFTVSCHTPVRLPLYAR